MVLNVEADPRVEVTRKGRTTPMTARKLEGRTAGPREIKIFHLTPR